MINNLLSKALYITYTININKNCKLHLNTIKGFCKTTYLLK